jgi:hypothetical protein
VLAGDRNPIAQSSSLQSDTILTELPRFPLYAASNISITGNITIDRTLKLLSNRTTISELTVRSVWISFREN